MYKDINHQNIVVALGHITKHLVLTMVQVLEIITMFVSNISDRDVGVWFGNRFGCRCPVDLMLSLDRHSVYKWNRSSVCVGV
jgi:hypothetical protein